MHLLKADGVWTDQERPLQSGRLDLAQYEMDYNVKVASSFATGQPLDDKGLQRIRWQPIKVLSIALNPGEHVYIKEKPGEKGGRRGV